MQGNGEFDDPQIGAEVTACGRYLLHQEVTDLLRQDGQLGRREGPNIARIADAVKQGHPASVGDRRTAHPSTQAPCQGADPPRARSTAWTWRRVWSRAAPAASRAVRMSSVAGSSTVPRTSVLVVA